jgi:hypothetical protein
MNGLLTRRDVCPAHARYVASAAALEEIKHPDVNLVLWSRALPPAVQLLGSALQSSALCLSYDGVAPAVSDIQSALRLVVPQADASPVVEWLARDVVDLSLFYAQIAGVHHPRVRLERVEDGCCVLFHEDSMELRLLCTYAGEGTEWVANDEVDRSQMGLQGRRVMAANAAIVPNPASVRSMGTGPVALFKGSLFPDGTPALVHRSAPVSRQQEYRIRLCIDATAGCAC